MAEFTVLFGIDTETDVGSWTPFYNGLEKGVPLLLDLFAKKGITTTFFIVGDVARKYPTIVKDICSGGHEVGCHSLYHETIGDPIFTAPTVEPMLPEEIPNRLRKATLQVAEVIGELPRSFRAPRLWGSTSMINALEDIGYLVDATYPLYYFKKMLAPYHPSSENWTIEGNLNILEIPNFADLTQQSKDPYGRDLDQWPLFRTKGANSLYYHIENFIQMVRRQNIHPVVCFYFHPWEFVEMPQRIHLGEVHVEPDYFLVQNCGPPALRELSLLIDVLKENGGNFKTARQIAYDWD